MKDTYQLKVSDVFDRTYFHNTEVVAGKGGLNECIRWVHILEITEIGHLLNGHELILTTGVGWQENEKLSLSFLKQLIDKKASGLCVELGTYIKEIPKDMIEMANRYNFPIISFKEEVRFIDITQDLNGLLMEVHNQMIVKLEAISNQFNRLLLNTNGFQKILRLLHQSLNVQVIYQPIENEPIFYPPIKNHKIKEIQKRIKAAKPQSVVNTTATSALKPVEALGNKFADLIILSTESDLTELDYLVLDRAATALSQDQLRLLYVEEKKKHEKNQWVMDWLHGKHSEEEVEQYFSHLDSPMNSNGCTVCICELDLDPQEIDFTYYIMVFRMIFEQKGYYPLVSYERNLILFALVNKRNRTDWKNRLTEAIELVKDTDLIKGRKEGKVRFGVGKLYESNQIQSSYKNAQETLYVQKKMRTTTMFYDDLYVHRLFLNINQQKDLQGFIEDYLGPLLENDSAKNGELLETLRVLLDVNGSRKDAADRLFIVRQTLYHRIDKLKELLGDDFMDGEKRLALELAIYAREFLN
ncbi:PucR family transcriptional regulator [Virgibacillus sp. W0430]|uniref:PucR family transcriptional regulator n=1 Tax=Virgibacillus sp. W0430 TaxID=3391580 RepID=UPI003F45E67D